MCFRKPLLVMTAMAMALVLSRAAFAAPKNDKKLQERYDALMKEYKEGMKSYQTKLSEYFKLSKSKKAEDKKKAQGVLQQAVKLNPSAKLAPKFAKIAQESPKSKIGKKAMFFVLQNNRTDGDTNQNVVDLLKEHHYAAEDIGRVMNSLVYARGFDPVPLFKKVVDKNPHKNCKGLACFAWAKKLMQSSRGGGKPNPKAIELMKRVVKEFGDVKYFNRTLGKVAIGAIFEIEHLQIGMTVPEIVGEDVDGKSFKLSDYRGKVVMIDFWGDW